MQADLVIPIEEMSEQQILGRIQDLQKDVEDTNDRTLRLGERTERLKDFVNTDVNVRLVRVDERTSNMMWAIAIMAAAIVGSWSQLILMNGRLGGIERDVSRLLSSVGELELKKASENPSDPQNIQQVKQILADAKTSKITITPKTVVSEGKKFIDAAQAHPDAWSAALAFLDYKSFLNGASLDDPKIKNALVEKVSTTKYYRWTPANERLPGGKVAIFGTAPRDQAAIMAPVGASQETSEYGDQFVVVTGGNIFLDNTNFRHVIIANAHVIWRGGPVIMQDVHFIDCIFDLPQRNGQNLATAILDSNAVKFQFT